MTGIINFHSKRKGYFFIDCPELKRDVFGHVYQLAESYRHRHDLLGKTVSFTLGERNGREIAVEIQVIAEFPVYRPRFLGH